MTSRDIIANEKNFLGCLLRSPHDFFKVCEGMTADVFSLPHHRDIFTAIRDLSEAGRLVTFAALSAHLPEEYDDVGPTIGILATLRANAEDAGSAADYVDLLRDNHTRRRIASLADYVDKVSKSDVPPSEAIAAIEERLIEMVRVQEASSIKWLHEAAREALAQTAQNYQAKDTIKIGLETGIDELDSMIGPTMGGDLITIAAPSGHGKTALVTQILCAASQRSLDAARGRPAFFVSQEMQAAQIARRVMASWTSISTRKQRAGAIDVSEFEALESAVRATDQIRILFDESGRQKASTIARKARAMKRMHGIGAMAVDHLLLIKPENPKWTQVQTIENAAMVFKDLAKELDIVLFQLAQLTRESQRTGANWRFTDQALYGGDAIKQNSDIMLALTLPLKWLRQRRPDDLSSKDGITWQTQYDQWTDKAEIGTLKVRDGEDGEWTAIPFNGPKMLFGDQRRW